ncbi:MAG TPA: addiction module protein [Thermoanaerobaculia bacterium]|nr:addiction module protein [Thermoanaerobaculia bacterium]
MSEKDVFSQALLLPQHDRAELAARLLESLEQAPYSDVDQAWLEEIERRCASIDAGEAVTSDWNEFRDRVEREIFGR